MDTRVCFKYFVRNCRLKTAAVLNTKLREVENKIPDHAKYITTEEFNNLTAENFAVRLKPG